MLTDDPTQLTTLIKALRTAFGTAELTANLTAIRVSNSPAISAADRAALNSPVSTAEPSANEAARRHAHASTISSAKPAAIIAAGIPAVNAAKPAAISTTSHTAVAATSQHTNEPAIEESVVPTCEQALLPSVNAATCFAIGAAGTGAKWRTNHPTFLQTVVVSQPSAFWCSSLQADCVTIALPVSAAGFLSLWGTDKQAVAAAERPPFAAARRAPDKPSLPATNFDAIGCTDKATVLPTNQPTITAAVEHALCGAEYSAFSDTFIRSERDADTPAFVAACWAAHEPAYGATALTSF